MLHLWVVLEQFDKLNNAIIEFTGKQFKKGFGWICTLGCQGDGIVPICECFTTPNPLPSTIAQDRLLKKGGELSDFTTYANSYSKFQLTS
ncbi:hypothetical protein BH09BAC1_BH09BAC1_29180 [soil metagenome]